MVDTLLRYGDFSIFHDRGHPSSWTFKIAILRAVTVKKFFSHMLPILTGRKRGEYSHWSSAETSSVVNYFLKWLEPERKGLPGKS